MRKIIVQSRRGLSNVIAAVLLILLAVTLVGIVWGVVVNLVKTETEKGSCLDTAGKVELNHQYICYNETYKELMFSISLGEVDIDKVVVSVLGGGSQKSFKISYKNSTVDYVRPYQGDYDNITVLPEKNAGLTYFYNMSAAGFTERPDRIEILPQIANNICSATDSATDIVPCYALD